MTANPSFTDSEAQLIEAYTTILNEPFEDKYEDRWEDELFDRAVDLFKARAQEIGFMDPFELLSRFNIDSYETIRAQLKKGPPMCFRQGWKSPLLGKRFDPKSVMAKCHHISGPKFDPNCRIVVFDFWATWCDPCVQAGPDLSDLAEEYMGRVAVVGVNNESIFGETNPPNMELLSEFLEANKDGFRYTIVVDNADGYAKETYHRQNAGKDRLFSGASDARASYINTQTPQGSYPQGHKSGSGHHQSLELVSEESSRRTDEIIANNTPINIPAPNATVIPIPLLPNLQTRKANATFVMLVREKDLHGARSAVRQIEDRFNHHYQYPYVFLNDVPFTAAFMESMRTMSKSEMIFGLISKEHWSYPDWISQEKAAEARRAMRKIIYGSSESYRHMCRFVYCMENNTFTGAIVVIVSGEDENVINIELSSWRTTRYQSGFLVQHVAMLQFDYYWRIEPDVQYSCDIEFDPFLYMLDNNKKYGRISIHDSTLQFENMGIFLMIDL
ncbi:alpha 1,2-mannosyltransferase 2.4.1 [Haplosporangium sp. Z 11]|nr:alpha 1,2-mannosyltransferase 2.4.1 [Haplosporangium sp. Z 11]